MTISLTRQTRIAKIGALGLTLCAVTDGVADAQHNGVFMPPRQAIEVLMDGQPWNARSSSGRNARITLKQDGTGTFEGPVTFSIKWEVRGQDICLILGFPGTKCTRFQPVQNGYAGFVNGKLDLTFSR